MNVGVFDQHKQYDDSVPSFLHNTPKTAEQHCMRRDNQYISLDVESFPQDSAEDQSGFENDISEVHISIIEGEGYCIQSLQIPRVACTDENAKWNRGTRRNAEPKPLLNIIFRKTGEDIMDSGEMQNGSYRVFRINCMYTLDNEFKEAVINSNLLPVYSNKGTTASKSFTCKPFTKDIIHEDHGKYTALNSCGKCSNFLN
ncbi:unnamed protein product [Mytilus coruscus]|uniref:Uncharacterized protein n=1 Tax=Mytilus coruscus TaxID=42192 RepID=A0A6J8BHN1_MYTCO|nr:unnamed protein product [Mytilus coruscus]